MSLSFNVLSNPNVFPTFYDSEMNNDYKEYLETMAKQFSIDLQNDTVNFVLPENENMDGFDIVCYIMENGLDTLQLNILDANNFSCGYKLIMENLRISRLENPDNIISWGSIMFYSLKFSFNDIVKVAI